MKHLRILGAGTAGTMVANHIVSRLPDDWEVTVIDPASDHLYQPGLLYLPFGAKNERKMIRKRQSTLRSGVNWLKAAVSRIDTENQRIHLEDDQSLPYDFLVIASGSHIHPEETPGMMEDGWRDTIHDFYTLEGAQALREELGQFKGGRIVVNVVDVPIKCPVAPLEFLFLADDFFTRRKIRNDVELVYVTPLDGAFTRPVASSVLGSLLERKGIKVETDFGTGEVDSTHKILRSYDEREVPYDLLVTIPLHLGAEFIEDSDLGDDSGFVPTDEETLLVNGYDNIFAIGDATDLPTSKAGSVAHFEGEVLVENLLSAIEGKAPNHQFDGHANCFIETGFKKALLIDFNYKTEPLPGHFPLSKVGPFSLLKESRRNWIGKRAFRWIYWHRLLPGKKLYVPNTMSMRGKYYPKNFLPQSEVA
jgi:sulfide:quinone oxidoreductase